MSGANGYGPGAPVLRVGKQAGNGDTWEWSIWPVRLEGGFAWVVRDSQREYAPGVLPPFVDASHVALIGRTCSLWQDVDKVEISLERTGASRFGRMVVRFHAHVPLRACGDMVVFEWTLDPVAADGQQIDAMVTKVRFGRTLWSSGKGFVDNQPWGLPGKDVSLSEALRALAAEPPQAAPQISPLQLAPYVCQGDDWLSGQDNGDWWDRLGVEAGVWRRTEGTFGDDASRSGIIVVPIGLSPTFQSKELSMPFTLGFARSWKPLRDGSAIRTSPREQAREPRSGARLEVGQRLLTLRAIPHPSSRRSLGNIRTMGWRMECQFSTLGNNVNRQDALELWNARVADDLLRDDRVSFLPYFEPVAAHPSASATGERWQLLAAVLLDRYEGVWSARHDGKTDVIARMLHIVEHSVTTRAASFPALDYALAQVPRFMLTVAGKKPGRADKSDKSDVDWIASMLFEEMSVPTQIDVESVKNSPISSKQLASASKTHGVMWISLTCSEDVTRDLASIAEWITVEGVRFHARISSREAVAWISLGGRLRVAALDEITSRAASSGAELGFYEVEGLTFAVAQHQPVAPSSRRSTKRAELDAVSSDLDRSVRSESRLILAHLSGEVRNESATKLVVRERAALRGGIELNVSWQKGGTSVGGAASGDTPRTLIIQTQPLFVGMVEGEIGRGLRGASDVELGTFSHDRGWQLVGTQAFFAILPPAVMGEEAIRGSKDFDPQPGSVAKFRFGPPTVLHLRAFDEERRYGPLPWDLPRLLAGGTNQEGTGVIVREVSAELLYGLTMRIARGGLRAASLFRRRGWPVEARDVEAITRRDVSLTQAKKAREHWDQVDKALRSTVDVIEFFDANASRDEFLKIDSNVEWRLRTNARLADPFTTQVPPGDLMSGAPALEKDHLKSLLDLDAPLSHPLWGGATIGFESQGVLQTFVREGPKGSSGGQVSGFMHGPHGATASFKSEFERGLLAIECVIEQGVVTRYVVSRMGRIGCLWNHARHVVVYERTAMCNPRYTEATSSRQQERQTGRAFLRKVDEYIEVLQTRRTYPDSGAAERLCACLAGSDFGNPDSAKYRVEAHWGRDVFDDANNITGWMIPIWKTREDQIADGAAVGVNEGGDPARSGIHAKPTISLLMRTKRSDGQADHQIVDDPQKLVFYTKVIGEAERDKPESYNIDKWLPVRDIDYCDLPKQTPDQTKRPLREERDGEGLDGAPDADEDAITPGYEAFTLTLQGGARPADLMHGRRADPLLAMIGTVTIGRAGLKEAVQGAEGDVKAVLEGPRDVLKLLNTQRDTVLGLVRTGLYSDATKAAKDIETVLKTAQAELERLRSTLGRHNNLRGASDALFKAADAAKSRALSHFDRLIELSDRKYDAVALPGIMEQALLQGQVWLVPFDQVRHWIEELVATLAKMAREAKRPFEMADQWLTGLQRECAQGCASGTVKATELLVRIEASLDELVRRLSDLQAGKDKIAKSMLDQSRSLRVRVRAFQAGKARYAEKENDLEQTVDGLLDGIEGSVQQAAHRLDMLLEELKQTLGDEQARAAMSDLVKASGSSCAELCTKANVSLIEPAQRKLSTATSAIEWVLCLARREAEDGAESLQQVRAKLKAAIDEITSKVTRCADAAIAAFAQNVSQQLADAITPAKDRLKARLRILDQAADPGASEVVGTVRDFKAALQEFGESVTSAIRSHIDSIVTQANGDIAKAREQFQKLLNTSWIKEGTGLKDVAVLMRRLPGTDVAQRELEELIDQARSVKDEWAAAISDAARGVKTVDEATEQIRRNTTEAAQRVGQAAAGYHEVVTRAARAITEGKDIFAIAESGLELQRAFGTVPRVPGLEFNRKQISYHFDRAADAVRTTPMGALLDRAGEHLKGVGLRLPTDQFGEAFELPSQQEVLDRLKKSLSIGDLLPDLAGLKLSDLFPGNDLSGLSNNYVRVKHEFDPKTRTAAVQADIDYPLASETKFIDADILTVVLMNARLSAKTRLETVGGKVSREANGSIRARWEVRFGGSPFVSFDDTSLEFDSSGKFKFNLRPEKVRLSGVLGFIADKLRSLLPDDGDVVRYLRDALGLPRGVEVNIALPIPDTQGVTTGFSGLNLGASFMVALGEVTNVTDISQLKNAILDFEVGVGFNLAKKDRPFNISAFVLGGAGHIEVGLRYLPMRKQLRAFVDVSIGASASLAFGVAGVSGGVYAALSIVFRYEVGTGMRPNLVFSARLLIWGEVDVWGIVSANISIELRLAYIPSRDKLVAAGRLRIRIKICWCFTIKISVGFTIPSGVSEAELGMSASAHVSESTRRLAMKEAYESIAHCMALTV